MKNRFLLVGLLLSFSAFAQKDSTTTPKQDTIKVGNMVIVNSNKNNEKSEGIFIDTKNKKIEIRSGKKNESVVISGGSNNNDTILSVSDDTLKLGRYNLVKTQDNANKKDWQSMFEEGDFKNTKISLHKAPKELKQIATNWWVFDLGFANMVNHTEPLMYAAMPMIYPSTMLPSAYPNTLKLRNEKSSNVNIWIVQQKLNLYKHYWNLKYGIGIEMYNFRFEQPISFSNTAGNYIYYDNVNFSKNKLFVEYLSIPVQLNFHANPHNRKSFYASLGMSAGYLVQSHTKQISAERGKRKVNGNFNLNDLKLATIGELGIGSLRLYGSYSLTNMFDKDLTSLNYNPFAIGIRFSKF